THRAGPVPAGGGETSAVAEIQPALATIRRSSATMAARRKLVANTTFILHNSRDSRFSCYRRTTACFFRINEGKSSMLLFHISNKRERQQLEHSTGPIEFGRGPRTPDGPKRYVIRDDLCVSRDHVRVEEVQPGKVRIDNLSVRNPILVIGNGSIAPRS